MLLTGDIHLREESADVVFGEVLPGIYQEALARGEKWIVIAGDLLHVRYQVPVLIYNRLAEVLKLWTAEGLVIVLVPGNHDQVDLAGRNALEVLAEIPGVTVLTEPCWWGGVAWMPYRKGPEEIVRALLALLASKPGDSSPVLFMHAGVTGAVMNEGASIYDDEGVPLESLTPWTAVVCGHYHKPQRLGNVRYLGSPWQTAADEAGQEKGIWLAPDDFGRFTLDSMEFLPQQWGPRYHNLEIKDGGVLDFAQFDKRDIVRVKTAAGVDPEAVGKALVQAGIEHHTVTPTVESPQERLEVAQGSPLTSYAQAYMELKLGPSEEAWEMFEQIVARAEGVGR